MPNETKYQPDINQLDVRCGGQLVRDGHVESVHDQHVVATEWLTAHHNHQQQDFLVQLFEIIRD